MARRFHLHMDMAESEATMIKDAAKLVKLRPSFYVLDRILRVAELEIAQLTEQKQPGGLPEDIDGSSTMSGGSSGGPGGGSGSGDEDDELTAEKVKQRLIERRTRKIPGGKVGPLV